MIRRFAVVLLVGAGLAVVAHDLIDTIDFNLVNILAVVALMSIG